MTIAPYVDLPPVDPALTERLTFLGSADLETARALWRKTFGMPAPRSLRSEMLVRAIAYRMQVDVYGDVTFGSRHEGTSNASSLGSPVRARLIRVWRGEVYEVVTVDDGFEMNGKRYRSLSAIAREITGVRWNGLRFFGAQGRKELCRRQARG